MALGYASSCTLCQLREDFAMTEASVPTICQDISRFDARGVCFSAGEQEDAHEFWMAFSDRLREQFPPFATSFPIGVESAFVCRNCGRLPF